MSMYEMAKDAAKIAQKADNIELYQILLDVQQQALDMQEKQQALNNVIRLKDLEIEKLKSLKKLILADGKKYLVDPDYPDRPLCPICTKKFGYEVPMFNKTYCDSCKTRF